MERITVPINGRMVSVTSDSGESFIVRTPAEGFAAWEKDRDEEAADLQAAQSSVRWNQKDGMHIASQCIRDGHGKCEPVRKRADRLAGVDLAPSPDWEIPDLERRIARFLDSRGCTLWCDWNIASATGREKAQAFLEGTITEILSTRMHPR